MSEKSKSGVTADNFDADLLRFAENVFAYVRDDLRLEAKLIARDTLERTQEAKATVRSYINGTLLLSSLTAIRLHRGCANAQRYLAEVIRPLTRFNVAATSQLGEIS